MQGSVSQIFDLGPSFHFMKCSKFFCINKTKSYPFFAIK